MVEQIQIRIHRKDGDKKAEKRGQFTKMRL